MHPIEWLRAVARSDDVPQAALASEAASALSALADEPNGLLLACRRLLDRHPHAGALWWACARMISAADPQAEARAILRDMGSDQVGLSLAVDVPDDATATVVGASEMVAELAERRGDLRILAVAGDGNVARSPRTDRFAPSRWGVAGGTLDDVDDDAGSDAVVVVSHPGLGAAVGVSDVVLLEGWAVGTERFLAAPGSLAAAVVARHGVPTSGSRPCVTPEVWLAVGVGRRLPRPLFEAVQRRVLPARAEPWLACADLVDVALVDRVIEPVVTGCPAPPELQADSFG